MHYSVVDNIELEKPIVFFDLETTGVNTSSDRIVEIACIKVNTDYTIVKLHEVINPQMHIPIGASEVHGIYNEDVEHKPIFRDVAKKILNFFEGCDIGGYNSNSFDVPLLASEFERAKLDFNLTQRRFIDVLTIERALNPMTLSEVYKRYTGHDLEDAHTALADVEATIAILNAQVTKGGASADMDDLDKVSMGGKERVDIANKLTKINDVICWNFGKHKNKPITEDIGYAKWAMNADFPFETKQILNTIVKELELNIKREKTQKLKDNE